MAMESPSQPTQLEHVAMSEEVPHEHTINSVNLLFGCKGWSSKIQSFETDFVRSPIMRIPI